VTSLFILCRAMWQRIGTDDPRKRFAQQVSTDLYGATPLGRSAR